MDDDTDEDDTPSWMKLDTDEMIVIEPEPKNNDGRSKCFWCGHKTIKKAWVRFYHHICEICQK